MQGVSMATTIKAKLTISIATVTILVLGLGLFALQVQESLNNKLYDLGNQAEKLAILGDLQLAVNEALMPGNDYIITGNPQYRQDSDKLDKTFSQYQTLRAKNSAIFQKSHNDPSQPRLMEEMDYQYAAPLLQDLQKFKEQIRLSFGKAQQESDQLRTLSRHILTATFLGIVLLLVIIGLPMRNAITAPLAMVSRRLQEIAAGQGDLTKRITIVTHDEIGELGTSFNRFTDQLQTMVGELSAVSTDLAQTAQAVGRSSLHIHEAAQAQVDAIGGTAASTAELDCSIRAIASDTDRLKEATNNISAAALELSSSLDGVTNHTQRLDDSADNTLAAINEIVAAFNQIAGKVVVLSDKAGEVAASALQISTVAKEINNRSQEQAAVARSVKDDAISLGLSAINNTKERMDRIRTEVSATTDVMGRLGVMSGEIGRIINIISDITDKTNLLALNASILAAQAGVHGKGFAVVAEEVKGLAVQAAHATKEITTMISQIQQGTATAVNAANRSATEVDAGVKLTEEVAAALNKIIAQSELSLQNALLIARAAEEQTLGISMVSEAMQQTSLMVDEISHSANEHKLASERILQATEEMRGFISSVRNTVSSQTEETQRIADIITETFKTIQIIAMATQEQQNASQTIIEAFATIREKAQDNRHLTIELDGTVQQLNGQAQQLSKNVNQFTI
jgi:methyl-accepting chemotaxis protein